MLNQDHSFLFVIQVDVKIPIRGKIVEKSLHALHHDHCTLMILTLMHQPVRPIVKIFSFQIQNAKWIINKL